jgi:hypothetical protein
MSDLLTPMSGIRCQTWTNKGKQCSRRATCWHLGIGSHCRQHMRLLMPRDIFWM